LTTTIERLADNILYAPNLKAVRNTNVPRQRYLDDLREVRASLEPVQQAMGGEILSSAIILTPERMQKSLAKNPWEVLVDVRPVHLFSVKRMPPEGMPVMFEHSGVRYMGWQVRGTIAVLFDCQYEELWVPRGSAKVKTGEPLITRLSRTVRQTVKGSETRPVVTPSPLPKKRAGEVFRDHLRDGSSGPEMVWIPADKFKMGSNEDNNEKPIHEVMIAYEFAMGKYPITFDEYDLFCQATQREKPSDAGWGRGKRPVINIDWQNAKDYCQWLSEQTGKQYRLPSEAEWEYAGRAGTTTQYSFGDNENRLQNYAWYDGNAGSTTHPVGEKRPNPWGLYDMHGNVWEWCEDVWHGDYKGVPTDGSAWVSGGEQGRRALRGGSWFDDSNLCRVANRNYSASSSWYYFHGFRVLLLLP